MELEHESTEVQVCPARESPPESGSTTDFLQQIEVLDSSGLATFIIDTLQSIETRFQKSKQKIDIVTYECIATEFLQICTNIFNRNAENFQFRLEMKVGL